MENNEQTPISKRKPGRPSTNDSRKQEIIDKATQCFFKFGYNKTTLDEIGESIGFNKAALYYYFKNKEELFVQVLNNQIKHGLINLKTNIEEIENPENKFFQYFWHRTKFISNVLRLTNLSNENILDLHTTFESIYSPFKKSEKDFLAKILTTLVPHKSKTEIDNFVSLCFDVVNSLSLSALMLQNILSKDSTFEEYNKKKDTVLQHLLTSFRLK